MRLRDRKSTRLNSSHVSISYAVPRALHSFPTRRSSDLPSGLVQLRVSKRLTGSNASNAAHSRACRPRKYAVAGAARSLAPLMDVVDQARNRVGVGVGPDAVA